MKKIYDIYDVYFMNSKSKECKHCGTIWSSNKSAENCPCRFIEYDDCDYYELEEKYELSMY